MLQRLLIVFILLSGTGYSYSQTPIADSLRNHVYRAASDAQKLQAVLALCEEHQSLNRDTLDKYAVMARTLADAASDRRSKGLAAVAMANDYLRWGWMDSCIVMLDAALQNSPVEDATMRDIYFKLGRLKGLAYGMRSDFKSALGILYRVIADAEKYNDSMALCSNYNTLGSISIARNQLHEALNWLRTAKQFTGQAERYKTPLTAISINMGNALKMLGKTDSALWYIQQGITLSRQLQNLNYLATALRVESELYMQNKQVPEAEAALKEMLAVRARLDNGVSILVDDNILLIDFYINAGQIDRAIALCKERLQRGDLYADAKGQAGTYSNNVNLRITYYEALARCYKKAGDDPLYQQTLEEIIAAKDSFYLTNSAEAIAEMQTKYEVQKKETTIIQQKLDLVRKNNLFYGSVAFLVFAGVLTYVLFTGYRKKQQFRLQQMQEEEKRSALQAITEAEENERKRIAADLHDSLGAYAASIVSNVDFIQPGNNDEQTAGALQDLRTNSRAIVSQLNDTIWVLKKDAMSLTNISDRIKVFLQRLQPGYPAVKMNVTERLQTDTVLPPSQAFHLFRIIQEAVNNALKHSGCKVVNVLLESNGNWKVVITDDGKGIATDSGNLNAGNGLTNMRSRAAIAGWSIQWLSDHTGTQVVIDPTTT